MPGGVAEIKARRMFKPKRQKMREDWKNYRIKNFMKSMLFSIYQDGQIKERGMHENSEICT